ncbi:hypothetical protein AAG570_011284 [Ranatra chinensis]|uniref:Metal-dependent protein hydrolase n=1 Tax=Ranatra chinensis TaxID=642074 RepID=A0ABD0YK65_9HEMI
MLKLLYPNLKVVRSRDYDVLSKCDIVIDVGGEYDPSKYRFDHHQRGFNHSVSTVIPGKPWTTKLSSAGLIYCHFGREIIKKVVEDLDSNSLEPIFDKLYEGFVQEIDGIDNGIELAANGELNYRITTNLSARVSHFNQKWNEKSFDEWAAFEKAVEYAGGEFKERILYLVNVWWPARSLVEKAIENRFQVHPTGEIIELETFCPWEEHFFQLEKQMKINPAIKYLLFTDRNGDWRVRAVPEKSGSFVLRLPLHETWRGLNKEELVLANGIEGSNFVHSSGFIGGNKTKDGALKMAVKSLELNKKNE